MKDKMSTRKKQRRNKNEDEEKRIRSLIEKRVVATREKVDQLSQEQLREVVNNAISRQPSLIFTVLDELENNGGESPKRTEKNILPWCTCGECKEMPTVIENVCCGYTDCLSKTAEFALLALEPMVLTIANGYRNDFFGFHTDDNVNEYNKSLRHAAYRQFTLWRSGYLGASNRKVIPSCCVWSIRTKFPSPSGVYMGFNPGRLI